MRGFGWGSQTFVTTCPHTLPQCESQEGTGLLLCAEHRGLLLRAKHRGFARWQGAEAGWQALEVCTGSIEALNKLYKSYKEVIEVVCELHASRGY